MALQATISTNKPPTVREQPFADERIEMFAYREEMKMAIIILHYTSNCCECNRLVQLVQRMLRMKLSPCAIWEIRLKLCGLEGKVAVVMAGRRLTRPVQALAAGQVPRRSRSLTQTVEMFRRISLKEACAGAANRLGWEISRLVETALTSVGSNDVLINNAG
jgi:hypothetical protein